MEPQSEAPKRNNLTLPVAVAAIVVIGIIGYYLYSSNGSTTNTATAPEASTPSTNTAMTANPTTTTTMGTYKNGEYEADGNYVSPGGPREIKITITIADGKITDSTFAAVTEPDPTSKRFQKEFSDNYKAMIVGKSLDEVNLTKVAGSSLTPKGFNDALTKIKTEAKG